MEHSTSPTPQEKLAKTRLVVLTGLLLAIALVLAMIENTMPPLVAAVPGVKLGLSNMAVMYSLFFLKKSQAFSIAVLKSVFVLAIRGPIAGFLSLFGGILSLLAMLLLLYLFHDRISYLLISIFGAIFHNIGQIVAVSLIYTTMNLWVYLPLLLLSGLAAGSATAILLRLMIPALQKIGLK